MLIEPQDLVKTALNIWIATLKPNGIVCFPKGLIKMILHYFNKHCFILPLSAIVVSQINLDSNFLMFFIAIF